MRFLQNIAYLSKEIYDKVSCQLQADNSTDGAMRYFLTIIP